MTKIGMLLLTSIVTKHGQYQAVGQILGPQGTNLLWIVSASTQDMRELYRCPDNKDGNVWDTDSK